MAESEFEQVVFGTTKFSDILADIYNTAKKKEKQISELIAHLNTLVNTVTEAQIIIPLIKEFLDIDVKNDDIVVKMAAIIQRSVAREKLAANGEVLGGNGFSLTPEELKDLEDLREEALKSSNVDLKHNIEQLHDRIEFPEKVIENERDEIDELIDEVEQSSSKSSKSKIEEDKMLAEIRNEIHEELLGGGLGR